MSKSILRRTEEALLRGVIWGLVGGIYALLFVGFLESFRYLGFPELGLVFAGSLAGAVGAAFYGAMQIAILGTLAGVVATFFYLVLFASQVQPHYVLLVAGAAGMVLGVVFGAMHVFLTHGALSKMISGLIGGAAAAAIVWLAFRLIAGQVNIGIIVGMLVPITGYVYVAVAGRLERVCGGRVPDPLVGALVAGSLASVVGASVWAVGGTATESIDPSFKLAIDQGLSLVPSALAGGVIGGILSGSLLGLMGLTPRH